MTQGPLVDAVSFLRGVAAGERPTIGRRVAVYGGGNTAMDAARTARRLGADEALIIYRRTRAQMPAHEEEAQDAEREGVRINWLRTIKAIDGHDLRVEVMELDADGFPQPTGRLETLAADTVILALGQDTDTAFLRSLPGVQFERDGAVKCLKALMTGCPGVFAGGDMVPANAPSPSASGTASGPRRTSTRGCASSPGSGSPQAPARRASTDVNLWYFGDAARRRQPELDPHERIADFAEVVGALPATEAGYEAGRCLSCGNCCECDGCVGRLSGGRGDQAGARHRYRFDYDRCTGCRACFEQCPVHSIEMFAGTRPEAWTLAEAHDRRQRGGGLGGLPAQRDLLHLPDHAVLADGRAGGRVVQPAAPQRVGHGPAVVEMQSEGGAAGALHGALQGGALGTTFTASQGLLLMIPNMYKIAGELTAAVLHVAARSLAAQGLSIFGDHSDVMAVRQTGFALLASASVQEAHDLALVAQAATLATRVPFIHFFDGFRTSHELNTIELLSDDDLRALVSDERWSARTGRARSPPSDPFIRGTAQNPDVYFQARETVNPFYARVPGLVQDAMDAWRSVPAGATAWSTTAGTPRPSGCGDHGLGRRDGPRDGRVPGGRRRAGRVVQVRLVPAVSGAAADGSAAASGARVAVLDRTKEPGSLGEPLFLDVLAALTEAHAEGERESCHG